VNTTVTPIRNAKRSLVDTMWVVVVILREMITTIPRKPMDQRTVVLMVATVLMVMGMVEMEMVEMEGEENETLE
tara:strand:- start:25 stop:246 length:222 start_codon:yes stop_codon:yes gene_type:complete